VEISFNIETELFVEFSLSWLTLPFISIDDVPLLVDTVISIVDTDVSVLLVDVSNNFEDLSFLVDNIRSLISEHLPPS
jgi:hypothetical protein